MINDKSLPSTNPALRQSLYAGGLFLLDETTTSIALIEL